MKILGVLLAFAATLPAVPVRAHPEDEIASAGAAKRALLEASADAAGMRAPAEQEAPKPPERPDLVREYFRSLPSRIDPESIRGMRHSYLFDVRGAGRWVVSVQDGRVAVSEGPGDAQCALVTTEETFLEILSGELHPATAHMTGRLQIRGDISAALKIHRLFPSS